MNENGKLYIINSWWHWCIAWIVFIFVFQIPAIITQSTLLTHFNSILFLLYLSLCFSLKKYKNNWLAFKIGKDSYFPFAIIPPFLFCLFFSDIRVYALERIYISKAHELFLENKQYSKKSLKEAQEYIENIDYGLMMLAFPSRLMGTMVDTILTPVRPDENSGHCRQLFYKKLKSSINQEIHIQGGNFSENMQIFSESGYLKYLITLDSKSLNKKVEQSLLDKIKEERETSKELVFGSLSCSNLLKFY